MFKEEIAESTCECATPAQIKQIEPVYAVTPDNIQGFLLRACAPTVPEFFGGHLEQYLRKARQAEKNPKAYPKLAETVKRHNPESIVCHGLPEAAKSAPSASIDRLIIKLYFGGLDDYCRQELITSISQETPETKRFISSLLNPRGQIGDVRAAAQVIRRWGDTSFIGKLERLQKDMTGIQIRDVIDDLYRKRDMSDIPYDEPEVSDLEDGLSRKLTRDLTGGLSKIRMSIPKKPAQAMEAYTKLWDRFQNEMVNEPEYSAVVELVRGEFLITNAKILIAQKKYPEALNVFDTATAGMRKRSGL